MKILAWTTFFITYFLMVWGNVVSSTGSGLACPDYPLCYGTITPPARPDVILEWGHRLIAAVAGILILTTIYKFWKSSKTQSFFKGATNTLGIILFLQIALGGVTVLLELSKWVSTVHLLIANLVFGGLLMIALLVSHQDNIIVATSPKLERLAKAAVIGLFVQFALGGLVRHGHAGMACPAFPNCTAIGFFPEVWTFETFVAFFHRWWGILLTGAFVHLVIAAKKAKSPLFGWSIGSLLIIVFMILLGWGTVMSALNTHARATHAGVGYLLMGVTFYIAFRAGAFQGLWRKRVSGSS